MRWRELLPYKELILYLVPELKGKLVDEAHFEACLKDYLWKQKKLEKNTALNADFWLKSSLMHEEFRIIAACTKNQYMESGKDNSSFSEKNEREFLWAAFHNYKTCLNGAAHLPFYRLKSKHKDVFSLIIVDEYQALPLVALTNLYTCLCSLLI